jgi:hypothetical protein
MTDFAMFQGGLVAMKNVGYDASVHLTIAIPQEFGQAVVAAFGWPTSKNPIPVAVARLEGAALSIASARLEKDGEQVKRPERRTEHKRFNELSYAEQAGILCQDPDFVEFTLRELGGKSDMDAASTVRRHCNVQSRADIKEWTPAERKWLSILDSYRRWQADRDRADVDF